MIPLCMNYIYFLLLLHAKLQSDFLKGENILCMSFKTNIFFWKIKLTKHIFWMVGMWGVISFPHLYTIFSQACKQCSLSSSSSTWAYFKTKGTTRSTWSPKRCPAWRQTAPKVREIRWSKYYNKGQWQIFLRKSTSMNITVTRNTVTTVWKSRQKHDHHF